MPLRNLIANSWMIRVDGRDLLALMQKLEYALFAALGVPLSDAGDRGDRRQSSCSTGWSGRPNRSRRNSPRFRRWQGAKRVFGKQALANFAKGLFKLLRSAPS